MADGKRIETLRIGFIGSGFIAKFHLQSSVGVRNVRSPASTARRAAHREALAARRTRWSSAPARPFRQPRGLLTSGDVDAIWMLAPNYTRLEHHARDPSRW